MNQIWNDQAPVLAAAFASTSLALAVIDATRADHPVLYVNAAFSALCGYPEGEIVGRNSGFLEGPATDLLVCAEIRAAVASGVGIRRTILHYRQDGTPFWNDLTIDPIRDPAARLTGFFVSSHCEASAARPARQATSDVQPTLDSITDNIPGYIYRRVMRTDGTIEFVYCSSSLSKMLGIDPKDGWPSFIDHVHPDDRDAVILAIRNSVRDMSVFREEFRLLSASGAVHWLRSEAPPRRMNNGEIMWDGLAVEISAEKRWEREIATLALRDPLTGLLTREAWRQALGAQFSGAGGEANCGLLMIDIAAFRGLNDRCGQRRGDDILREVAHRLARIAGSAGGTAARLGGDEFAILAPHCMDEAALSDLAHASSEDLARPMECAGQMLSIQTCIGATLHTGRWNDHAADMDLAGELMTQAELALSWAKQEGCSGYIIYSAAQDDRVRNRAMLARSLERAIADGELKLHYQPLVDLATGRIVSAEALVRWNHPTLGMQRPDLFIPLAEKSGLIVPLGYWVLEQALRQRRQWHDAGLAPPPIAINVSGNQLVAPGFVGRVANIIEKLEANAKDFEIELTEGELIEASPQIMESLHALRAMGFTITIDDFGSGHASFRYLRDFPLDKVKIDQLFVSKLVLESNDALIIRAVISLARSMGIALVAEGVETEMQRDFLQREGCEIGQGYFFSMPLVAEDFAWLLQNDVNLPPRAPAERAAEGSDGEPERDIGTHGQ